MSRPVASAGGDVRLGGGLGLGSHSGVEKPGAGKGAGQRTQPSGSQEKHRSHGDGGKLPRGGGKGLGFAKGAEKPESPEGGPEHGHYADPGYQADGKHRLPVHSEAHTRASLRAFNKLKGTYKPSDQLAIGRALALAAKRHGVDPYENAMRK